MNDNISELHQEDWPYALECLESCKLPEAADRGFPYPYFAPGSGYSKQWWLLDSSLALSGYKWFDRAFCERALLNFVQSQQADGRLCLWGSDLLPQVVGGNAVPMQREGVSSLPKIFDVAYHILQGTDNTNLIAKTYQMLKKYLDWWYQERFDEKTGLISSVFEETFTPYLGKTGEYAAVDTNVEVYVGLTYTSELADLCQDRETAAQLRSKAAALKEAINTYLWDAPKGAYYPYCLKTGERNYRLMASTFYPLRMQIAPAEHQKRLIQLLVKHDAFNWDTIPLTSVSKEDPTFQVTVGGYQGGASWSGNVWTLINEMVVRGLLDCGENALAAQLALKTIHAFSRNCAEFVNPFDGTGHGVLQYAWTASQYLELIIEVIFGIHVNRATRQVQIAPNLTPALGETTISIGDIMVFDGVFLDVTIDHGKITYRISDKSIAVTV